MTDNLEFEHGKWKAACPHCGKDISKIVNEAVKRVQEITCYRVISGMGTQIAYVTNAGL